MTKLIRSILLSALILVGASAQASSFTYSYTFGDGSVVKGSFDGDASGDVIANMRNVTLNFRGVQFVGTLFDTVQEYGGISSASFSGLQNSFDFADTPDSPVNAGFASLGLDGRQSDMAFAYVYGQSALDDNYSWTTYSADRWHVSAVPEADAWAMMVVGLGLVGAMARKRQSVKAA